MHIGLFWRDVGRSVRQMFVRREVGVDRESIDMVVISKWTTYPDASYETLSIFSKMY